MEIMNIKEFLHKAMKKAKCSEGNIIDSFEFFTNEVLLKKTKGTVYGFLVELTELELINLKNEAKEMGTLKNENLSSIKPIFENFYALYWGKNLDAYGRINAHLNGHKGGNSNLHLKDYENLTEKNIVYGTIYVDNNKKLEDFLLENYPPLLKTKKN